MARWVQIGDSIIITRKETVQHFRAGGQSIKGKIVDIDPENAKGCPYGIEFDDRPGWTYYYARWEFKIPRKGR